MIDKAAQRLRAQQMSQELAAQGQHDPVLTYPTPKKAVKAAPRGPSDKIGTELKVGQKVARATSSGYGSDLSIQTVTKVDGDKVYLDNSPQALKKLNNVLVLK